MSEKIKIGVIGAGENTRKFHIPNFQKIEGVEVISVCNRSKESGQKVADEFSIQKVFTNWKDLVKDPDINAVCIGTWPYMHKTLVEAALNNGKHVMTEARMADSYENAKDMLSLSKESPGLIAQIVPAPMTLKFDKYIRQIIAEKEIGEIIQIDISISHQTPLTVNAGYPDYGSGYHWRNNLNLSGMNIMQLGIWYEAMMRWVGPAKNVYSRSKTVVNIKKDYEDYSFVEIPDHINIIGDLQIGATYNIKMSTVQGNAQKDGVWIFGTEGTLMLDCIDYVLYKGDRKSNLKEIVVPDNYQSFWRVEEEFISAIRGKELITHTPFETGVKYMEFTEAARKSANSGERIDLSI